MAKTWETVRGELKIDDKDEAIVQIEKDLIRTMIKIRDQPDSWTEIRKL